MRDFGFEHFLPCHLQAAQKPNAIDTADFFKGVEHVLRKLAANPFRHARVGKQRFIVIGVRCRAIPEKFYVRCRLRLKLSGITRRARRAAELLEPPGAKPLRRLLRVASEGASSRKVTATTDLIAASFSSRSSKGAEMTCH